MCEIDKEKLKTVTIIGTVYYIWYEDSEYLIAFSDIPDVRELQINKFIMDKKEIEDIKKKPYKLYNDITVYLEEKTKNNQYLFDIKKGYRYDGASIPKAFWRLIGSKGDVRFLIGALIHDYMCENHNVVEYNRYFADKIFERCCYVGGTCAFIRWLMFHCVDNYQKFCGWK